MFVNLEAVYPDRRNPNHEICFEELRAASRGWLTKNWSKVKRPLNEIHINTVERNTEPFLDSVDVSEQFLAQDMRQRLILQEESSPNENKNRRLSKARKMKIKEVGETQTSEFSAPEPMKAVR